MQARTYGMPLIGALIALVGAWGGILPYAGPSFGYPMPPGSPITAWEWTASNWQLHLAAGVPALVGGLMLGLARARRPAMWGAALGVLAGSWFVLGPVFAPVFQSGGMTGGGMLVSDWVRAATPLGYHYGTGLFIALLSAYALARLAAGPRVAEPASTPVPPEAPAVVTPREPGDAMRRHRVRTR